MTFLERLATSALLVCSAPFSRCRGQIVQTDTVTAKDTLPPVVCRQVITKDTMIAKGDTALMISFCAPMQYWLHHMNPHPQPEPIDSTKRRDRPT